MTQIKKYNDSRDLLSNANFQAQLAQVLPKHLTADRMARLAIAAMTRTPKLKECTRESVFRAMMDASMLGLEPDGRHGHLVPYKTECQFIVDYKGLATLLMETGQIKRIYADVVCENDEYEENMGQVIKHIPNRREPRGEAYAVYCVIDTVQGGQVCQIMGAAEVEQVRSSSPAGRQKGGPWDQWKHEMWKKTAFKRACKWMSLRASNAKVQDAIEYDDGVVVVSDNEMLQEPESRLDAIAENGES